MANLLVVERLQLERLDDVSDELGVDVRVPNLVVQKLSHGSLRLGTDLLRLVADVEHGDLDAVVGFEATRHHADERCLTGAVLAQHDDDLGIRELAFLDAQLETSCTNTSALDNPACFACTGSTTDRAAWSWSGTRICTSF